MSFHSIIQFLSNQMLGDWKNWPIKSLRFNQLKATKLAHWVPYLTGNPTVCLQTEICDVFRHGRWSFLSLFFRWFRRLLPRFSGRMWRLWKNSSRVVIVTVSVWLLREILLYKMWISLSQLWAVWRPLCFALFTSRPNGLSSLWWL